MKLMILSKASKLSPSTPRRWKDGKLHAKVNNKWVVVPEPKQKEKSYVDSKGKPTNRPEGGFWIQLKVDGIAVRVPEEIIEHTFKHGGRTWVVHRKLIGDEWSKDYYSATDAETGLGLGGSLTNPYEMEERLKETWDRVRRDNGATYMQNYMDNIDPVASLPASDTEYPLELPFSTEKAKGVLDEFLEDFNLAYMDDLYRMMLDVDDQGEFDDNMDYLGEALNEDLLDKVATIAHMYEGYSIAEALDAAREITTFIYDMDMEHGKYISWNKMLQWADRYGIDPADLRTTRYDIYRDGVDIDGELVIAQAIEEDVNPMHLRNTLIEKMEEEANAIFEGSDATYTNLPFYEREKMLIEGIETERNVLKLNGNVNETYKVRIEVDGGETIDGVFKPVSGENLAGRMSIDGETCYIREHLSYSVAKAFGSTLIPPTEIRQDESGEWGSVQEWRYGYKTQNTSHTPLETSLNVEWEASILDFLLFNTDRHANNYMVNQDDGSLLLIDHGLCLPNNQREPRFVDTQYYQSGAIPEDMRQRLIDTDWSPVINEMRDHGLDVAAEGLTRRLNHLMSGGRLPGSYAEARDAGSEESGFEIMGGVA